MKRNLCVIPLAVVPMTTLIEAFQAFAGAGRWRVGDPQRLLGVGGLHVSDEEMSRVSGGGFRPAAVEGHCGSC